jgi:hypothetical protein
MLYLWILVSAKSGAMTLFLLFCTLYYSIFKLIDQRLRLGFAALCFRGSDRCLEIL